MVEPYLNQVGGKVDNDVNLFTGGINTYQDKGFLDANQVPYAMNLSMDIPPRITTRRGRNTIAYLMDQKHWPYNIGTVIDFYAYNEYQIYAIVEKNNNRDIIEIYREYEGGHWSPDFRINPLMASIPKENVYYFTLAKQANANYLYISGSDLSFKIKITISDFRQFNNIEYVPDEHYGIVCAHKGRLFIADPHSNIVTFSALNDFDNFNNAKVYQLTTVAPSQLSAPDKTINYIVEIDDATYQVYKWDSTNNSWVTDGTIPVGSILIDTTTGRSIPDYSIIAGDFKITNSKGRIISLQSFDDKLMIFCEHSMHCMYGSTPDTSSQNQYQLVDLNNNLGALAHRCITIGGGRLFWLGDNNEIYEYTGASINMVSRPGKTRNSTLSLGGVSGVIDAADVTEGQQHVLGLQTSKFVATSEKLYVNIWNAQRGVAIQKLLFVFDMYNRTWWCEDGEFSTIGNFSDHENKILMGITNGDILINTGFSGVNASIDKVYNFENDTISDLPIEYELHTRVYGADGVDMRKTLTEIWFQAVANAEVYINDMWTADNDWKNDGLIRSNLVKIGNLEYRIMLPNQPTKYRPHTYEQQVLYLEKLYGQRLNAFQIVIKGSGASEFYLMKRKWRAK